jgi:ABC-2 type transport system permease protein/lipopolysaccharide transport system permease protein
MSSYVTESETLFTGSKSHIKQISLAFSVYVFRSNRHGLIVSPRRDRLVRI